MTIFIDHVIHGIAHANYSISFGSHGAFNSTRSNPFLYILIITLTSVEI